MVDSASENKKPEQHQQQVERCDLLALPCCKTSNADAPGKDHAGHKNDMRISTN